jgi:hypothetical protein
MPVYPPVWHQVLDLLSYANDPEVAQQAADALSQYETKQTDLAWFQPSL